MDQIYFWILILFFVILVLDFSDKYFKNKEKFENNGPISDSTIPPYYEENRLFVYEPPYTTNAVNFNSNHNLNFKNFGTNGITPPFVKCPSCNLQYDCANYPYDVDDKNMSVCTKCNENVSLNNNNLPVYGRAVGKPRVCRDLK
jgi:hypothetical protein